MFPVTHTFLCEDPVTHKVLIWVYLKESKRHSSEKLNSTLQLHFTLKQLKGFGNGIRRRTVIHALISLVASAKELIRTARLFVVLQPVTRSRVSTGSWNYFALFWLCSTLSVEQCAIISGGTLVNGREEVTLRTEICIILFSMSSSPFMGSRHTAVRTCHH